MPNSILVQHNAVYAKTSELHNRVRTALAELDARYSQIQSRLGGLDSATNAHLIEAMKSNQEKAHIAGETLSKLLSFIANTSLQAEIQDNAIGGSFQLSNIVWGEK